ncbi:MAG: 50S ribosomal protein L32 [Planctomycetes bacterium]|jgi:large subunit ribosomal protein L32|nr:50S ribosomal protein L32 [Planctomycetota bacterium]
MAVPKKRTSKMKKRLRRSHHRMARLNLARCAHCGAAIRPHRVCHNCGQYKGEAVIQMDEF